jgi:hypothetical protein
MLAEHDFGDVAHFGADDAQRRYFGQANMGMPDVQRLVTGTVAASTTQRPDVRRVG